VSIRDDIAALARSKRDPLSARVSLWAQDAYDTLGDIASVADNDPESGNARAIYDMAEPLLAGTRRTESITEGMWHAQADHYKERLDALTLVCRDLLDRSSSTYAPPLSDYGKIMLERALGGSPPPIQGGTPAVRDQGGGE
jgi:hypothetical protein